MQRYGWVDSEKGQILLAPDGQKTKQAMIAIANKMLCTVVSKFFILMYFLECYGAHMFYVLIVCKIQKLIHTNKMSYLLK